MLDFAIAIPREDGSPCEGHCTPDFHLLLWRTRDASLLALRLRRVVGLIQRLVSCASALADAIRAFVFCLRVIPLAARAVLGACIRLRLGGW